jgi:Ca-activated chloride channel family protein
MIRHALILAAAALATQPPTFRAGVEVVTVDVSVTRGDVPVSGLTADDFVVTDNGIRQRIDTVAATQVPLNLTLVFDTSGSVAGERLHALVTASEQLMKELRPDDYLSLITFTSGVDRRVTPTTNFESVRAALHAVTASGDTSLRDALFLALQTTRPEATRPLLLIFTDGADTSSFLSADEVLESVRHADVVIHAVSFGSQPFLSRATHEAGGRIWSASSNRDLQALFSRAIRDMRDRYVLTYSPNGVSRSGWHALRVKLDGKKGDVVARPGYWVRARESK